jgi:bidirectional [NiFe] hydrogenase diaphorase subunit
MTPRLRCCGASSCRFAGSEPLRHALEAARSAAGLSVEQLEIRSVGCLRLCGRGPLVASDGGPGGPALHGELTLLQAPLLVAAAIGAGQDPGPLVAHRLDLEHPFFRLQQPVVLEGCGLVDPESIDDALAHGTYEQLRLCLEARSPEQVRDLVRCSGLRGRGGAGYPTALKWDTVALQPPGPRYVVCNADEGDPGAFMDRSVLEGDPHRLLEGMAIAAHAVGAEHGYVYVRAEYPLAIERLRLALKQAQERGVLGTGMLGSRASLTIEVRVGAGAYVGAPPARGRRFRPSTGSGMPPP